MRPLSRQSASATTILTLVEIKAAIQAFDRGDANVFDTLDSIVVVLEAHRAAMAGAADRERPDRDAA